MSARRVGRARRAGPTGGGRSIGHYHWDRLVRDSDRLDGFHLVEAVIGKG